MLGSHPGSRPAPPGGGGTLRSSRAYSLMPREALRKGRPVRVSLVLTLLCFLAGDPS